MANEISSHDFYLAERGSLIASFNRSFNVGKKNAKKVSKVLLQSLLENKKKEYKVDLFISDTLDKEIYKNIGEEKAVHASYTFNIDINQTSYKLNGQLSTQDDIEINLDEEKKIIDRNRKLLKEKRKRNIQKIASILTKNKELSNVMENAPGYITLTLSKYELLKLIKNSDNIIRDFDFYTNFEPSNTLQEWVAERNGYFQGVSLTQMHGVWNSYFSNTRGENIGIYFSDVLCPDNQFDLYEGYAATHGDYFTVGALSGTIGTEGSYHTRIIMGILGTVANEANLYCNSANLTGNDYYANVIPTDLMLTDAGETDGIDAINVESYSLNRYSTMTDRSYTAMDALFDHHSFVNYTIPVFISSANTADDVNLFGQAAPGQGDVVSPAKAFNVVTVGSYERLGDGDQRLSDFSSFIDPTIGGFNIRKPEVSAPGEHFHCTDIPGDSTCSSSNESSGTSFATPWTAALAADVMSQGAYWRSSAAMMKAVVIAGATDPITVANRDIRDRVGEGGVDLFTMTWQLTNSAYWRDWNPDRPFTTNYGTQFDTNQCFTNWQVHLYADREQRLVISWLNDVDSANNLTDIPNEYTMELLNQNGTPVATAQEHHQGYQVINTSQPEGDYVVRVCQTNVHDGNRFDMGFAVSQRLEASVWNQ